MEKGWVLVIFTYGDGMDAMNTHSVRFRTKDAAQIMQRDLRMLNYIYNTLLVED